jgi:anti-sigma factor ChrR (cupin superfamily)
MLNMNLSEAVVSHPASQKWVASPAEGVTRIQLERASDESGHVTSFVNYAAGSSFRSHVHPLGEEIYVLEGTFSDEYGDYPAGTYLRNPPGSSHAPYSTSGCKLFVKLDQFDPDDSTRVIVRTEDRQWRPGIGNLRVLPLHEFGTESTALVFWPANEVFQQHRHWGGEEIVVLAGEFRDEHGSYPAGSWLRSPHMSQHTPYVGQEETLILVKVGHLGDTL